MKRIKRYVRNKPHLAIGVPAIVCAITFVLDLVTALKDGVIDSQELNQLFLTAEGFETVVLFIIALVLRNKKK